MPDSYTHAGAASGPQLTGSVGGGGRAGVVPPVGFIDPFELVDGIQDVLRNGWRAFVTGVLQTKRSEIVAQAAAAAAAGAPLPQPYGFAVGLVGKQLLPIPDLSFAEYAAFATALRSASIRGRLLTSALPGAAGRFLRWSTGPVGLAVTGGSVLFFRLYDPDPGDDSTVWALVRAATTSGITDVGLLDLSALLGLARRYGIDPDAVGLDAAQVDELLVLVPYWTKDP